ncbi:hypothetical protein PoB_006222700 [Plakobranchus ocellatus]|uniref:Uncharacterized protein n=1 Tax=Plakobranchus ocellatus TaxID=259542 RepID=A0AAV4CUZ0_9GAST|nr:hypothetical protein PoB_006222700 [Plakobranchus ocellatus]
MDECMHLAYRDGCRNVPMRRSRRRSFARKCEINFLPTVLLDTERSRSRHNHLRCLHDLPGYHPCPREWTSDHSSPTLCDPLSQNSHHCVTTPDTIRTSCRVIEVCDQAVIVSGGWNEVIMSTQAEERVVRMAQLFRRNGIKKRNIKIFHANGVEQIQSKDEQPLRVYSSAMKQALRHHLQQMCSTVRCVDSLVLYLNSPSMQRGTMLLWDVDGNGMAEETERYSVEELLADTSNCSAKFVQVLVDQSYAGEISHAFKHSNHHGNVIVMASGRGHEYSYAEEFTHFWANQLDTRSCTSNLHKASNQFVTHSHPTMANRGNHRVTLSGAPCDVDPPFTNRELRREFFGCQNLPTAVWLEDVYRRSRSKQKNRSSLR